MSAQCSSVGLEASLFQRLSDYVGCQAQVASQAGFDPTYGGALTAAILTSCVTIYVALIGYRMLLGQAYDVRAVTLASLRIGVVIALCSSWASYETLVQDVVLRGPAQIVPTILRPSNVEPSAPTQVIERLQRVYLEVQTGTRRAPTETVEQAVETEPSTTPEPDSADLPVPALNTAGATLLLSTAGAYLALHLAAGVLVGLGPLLIPLALFDTCLGLVEGWVRALLGTMFGSATILIVSTFELDFLETELARSAIADTRSLSEQGLGITAVIFGMASWTLLVAVIAIICAFRFRRFQPPILTPTPQFPLAASLSTERSRSEPAITEPARAQSVAEAVIAQGRRDRASGTRLSGVAFATSSSTSHQPIAGSGGDYAGTLGSRRPPVPRRPIQTPRPESQ